MVILTIRMQALGRLLCLVIAILMMAAPAVAQPPSPDNDREQAVAQSPAETMDVFDLVRKLRHKETIGSIRAVSRLA